MEFIRLGFPKNDSKFEKYYLESKIQDEMNSIKNITLTLPFIKELSDKNYFQKFETLLSVDKDQLIDKYYIDCDVLITQDLKTTKDKLYQKNVFQGYFSENHTPFNNNTLKTILPKNYKFIPLPDKRIHSMYFWCNEKLILTLEKNINLMKNLFLDEYQSLKLFYKYSYILEELIFTNSIIESINFNLIKLFHKNSIVKNVFGYIHFDTNFLYRYLIKYKKIKELKNLKSTLNNLQRIYNEKYTEIR